MRTGARELLVGLLGLTVMAGCASDPTLDSTQSDDAFRDPLVYEVQLESVSLDPAVLAQAGIPQDGSFLSQFRVTGARHSKEASGIEGQTTLGIQTAVGPVRGPELAFGATSGLLTTRGLLAGGISLEVDQRSGLFPTDTLIGFCDFDFDPSQLPVDGSAAEVTVDQCQRNPWVDPDESPYFDVLDQTVAHATFRLVPHPLARAYSARLSRVAISRYLKGAWDDNFGGVGNAPDPLVSVRYGGGAPQPGPAQSNAWTWDAGLDIVTDTPSALTDSTIQVTAVDCDQGVFDSTCDPSEQMVQCSFRLDPIDLVAGTAFVSTAGCQEMDSDYFAVQNLATIQLDFQAM